MPDVLLDLQADPAQVRQRGRLARRVADRARGRARRRPEHVLRHAARSSPSKLFLDS